MAAPVMLDEDSFALLKRELGQLRQETQTLRRLVANISKGGGDSCLPFPRKIRFLNNNSGTAPAWGVLRITGATAKKYLTIDQPDSTYRWLYLVNGPLAVPTGKPGWGTFLTSEHFRFGDNYVLYDTGSGTPAYGEQWGPTASSWKLSKQRPGFFIFGGNNTESGKERTVAIQTAPGQVLVKNSTGSAIAAGASGTATLHGGTALSEATISLTMTVNNRSSVSWADGKYGFADLVNGQAYVSPHQT